jgi:hypothetical protein
MESLTGLTIPFLGVFGPLITGIAFTYVTKNKAGQRPYWLRLINYKHIGLNWLLIAVLFVPVLNGLSALIDFALGGVGAVWGDSITDVVTNPMARYNSDWFQCFVG